MIVLDFGTTATRLMLPFQPQQVERESIPIRVPNIHNAGDVSIPKELLHNLIHGDSSAGRREQEVPEFTSAKLWTGSLGWVPFVTEIRRKPLGQIRVRGREVLRFGSPAKRKVFDGLGKQWRPYLLRDFPRTARGD